MRVVVELVKDRRTEESIRAYRRTVADLRRVLRVLPPNAVPPREAAVAMAVLRGARTGDEVAATTGLTRYSAYAALRGARRRGLVTWETGQRGTLHTTLRVVE